MRPDLQPVPNEPALLLKEKKLLVVADLHIGIESELQENGLHVPSQTNLMEQRLISLSTEYEIRDIIILGDIKHMIPTITNQERNDVRQFLSAIQSCATLHLIPGNHDGNLDRLVGPDVQLHPSTGFVFDGVGFAHGHRWAADEVMQCEQVVIGHSHPLVMLTDRLGYRTFEQCWMRCPLLPDKLKEKYPTSCTTQVLIMPAFNPLCGGIAVNQEALLGPIGSLIDIDDAEVYLLDGCSIGRLKDLASSS